MTLINIITRKFSLVIIALCVLAPLTFISAQNTVVEPKIVVSPAKSKIKIKQKSRRAINGEETSAEKSIAVDAKVNITLCVLEGTLKVTGWERNEIRAFVSNGSKIGFDVREKNKENNPILLKVTGFDTRSKN